jgi:hypothetical protein
MSTISLAAVTSYEANQISVANCEAEIVANKNLQILKGKLDLLNAASQPLEILANNKTPSKKEMPAISLWVEEQKRCSAPGIAYHKSQSPEVGAIFEQAYTEMFISAADLYQGKITYGDFAKASIRRHQAVNERISVVVTKFREQQNEKAKQESLARQQELDRQTYVQQEIDRQKSVQQERCESLRQQILAAANSGPTPYQIQQQRRAVDEQRAIAYSQMNAAQRGTMGLYQGGEGIARALAGGSGSRDAEMQAAQQRQATINQQNELYRQNCQGN